MAASVSSDSGVRPVMLHEADAHAARKGARSGRSRANRWGMATMTRSWMSAAVCAATTMAAMMLPMDRAVAADPLGWSLTAANVGHCTSPTFACSPDVLHFTSQAVQYGFDLNAASSAADDTWGLAHASANPGSGGLDLPQLHADVTGQAGPFSFADYSVSFALGQAIEGYTWTGGSYDLPIDAFQGSVDFTNNGLFGEVSASLALFGPSLGEDPSLGPFWLQGGPGGGFLHGCADDAGAVGIGETGLVSTQGSVSVPLGLTSCGGSTYHLENGQTFYLWARIYILHVGDGATDASHTFDVQFNPDLDPTVTNFISSNLALAPAPSSLSTSVPEPSTWGLLVLGFGGLGAALRRRARLAA